MNNFMGRTKTPEQVQEQRIFGVKLRFPVVFTLTPNIKNENLTSRHDSCISFVAQFSQKLVNQFQALDQFLGLSADAQTQVVIHTKTVAGNDQHTFLLT